MKVLSLLIALIFALSLAAGSFAQGGPSRQEFMDKADRVRELIRNKKEQGADVSEAVKKAEEARAAFRGRDMERASMLLDEIEAMLGPGAAVKSAPVSEGASPDVPERVVSLDLGLKKAYAVRVKAKYKKGRDITDFDGAVEAIPLTAEDGKLKVPLAVQPVFITDERPPQKFPRLKPEEDSPFGFHPAKVEGEDDPYRYARDIGVSWHRPMRYFVWMLVQKDISSRSYDWSFYDKEVKEAKDLNLLYNIIASPPYTDRQDEASMRARRMEGELRKYARKNSYMPADEKAYTDFVTACVERYDGDGVDDMPGLAKPIKYWQIGNEPHPKMADFAEFVRITSVAIKKADPSAKVVIGGALRAVMEDRSRFDSTFLKILRELNGKYIDVIDFHWGGDAKGNYRGYRDIYAHLKDELRSMGYPAGMPVWITEMSTYSGDPVKLSFQPWDPPFQTEEMQAGDAVKRYVWGLANGVGKVFWAWGMMEGFKNNDSYFDHTGFIYDGKSGDDEGRGVRKLAYYSYKLMTGMLEGSDWTGVKALSEGKDNIYAYRFTKKSGKAVYVVWRDYFDERGF
ncbi:MAG: hypothetical protein HY893_08100 [Deltaproteobacteria bacterium]|nr:hypothetical protein [Deltaproteobacteria bacterium]